MPETDSTIAIRGELRSESIAQRNKLSPEIRHEWSSEIIAKLDQYLAPKTVSVIHCYLSFRSEVETREFIEKALAAGIRVIVPVVEKSDDIGEPVVERLAHTEIHEASNFVKGRFGIDEPAVRSIASLDALDALDAVIVPVVAFDRCGTRLGYGKGFYDMFLRELPRTVERIGLAFSIQEMERIPVLPHDEPLDVIITEREVI